MTAQLFPKPTKCIRQPTKQVLRQQLVTAADRIIELAAENQALRSMLAETIHNHMDRAADLRAALNDCTRKAA